ncbi:MAG: polyribonucleotide nucleotidyltransferase [Candidatus Omnitrophota bacterium]|nr:polyribonucleotide nucleotidyltransferase [Candidatus Omnitrophota bacterium]
MTLERKQISFGRQDLILETGKLAKQANGAVIVTYGGTVVLVTACISQEPKSDASFFPLTVEYQEKTYAAGKIPGGFFKKEGRPSESEILAARLIDRPIRPLFPEGLVNEVQVMGIVLSSDGEYDPDILAVIGASGALSISEIPFEGPIGACRVGLIEEQLVLNPTYEERSKATLDLVIVGTEKSVIMIEGNAKQIPEARVLEAIGFGFKELQSSISVQKELIKSAGKKKVEFELHFVSPELIKKVKDLSLAKIRKVCQIAQKEEREEAFNLLVKELSADLTVFAGIIKDKEVTEADVKAALSEAEKEEVRRLIIEENKRVDGRDFKTIRQITCEVGVLPCTHGSSLFTRGQTQSLAVTTLGTRSDEQMIEALEGKSYKTFMLHYNFPPFSVGETKPVRGPGRREIGHGALAERSLQAVMPSKEEFPYTVRVVSEILESNGSSSMATVCATSLSLMDAGVPIKETVAGISIGLVSDKNKNILFTDITGLEDHFGDMDFKVAGTKNGVTAIQLDLKIKGISLEVLSLAMQEAQAGRMFILEKMKAVLSNPRESISTFAPRIITLKINPEKIGEVIGPGGKNIRKIIETTGATIDIEDDGTVLVASTDSAAANRAVEIIIGMTEEAKVGKTYTGKIKRIMNFGAFCEILPGKEGLIHISELSKEYVKSVEDVVKVGDEVKVKVIEIDELGRVNLSKKQAE